MSIGKKPCPGCGGPLYRGSRQCKRCFEGTTSTVDQDREQRRTKAEESLLRRKYDDALKTIERQESELRSLGVLNSGRDVHTIEPKLGHGTNEGTVVVVASDWHSEEKVGVEVGGLNRYNLDIAGLRSERFFQSALQLVNLLGQDIRIETIVLALLGDFITNNIHDELKDLVGLQPMQAIVFVQNLITSGIQYLLDNSTSSW